MQRNKRNPTTQRGRIRITGFDAERVRNKETFAEWEVTDADGGTSRMEYAWRRFRSNRLAMYSVYFMLFTAVVALFARPITVSVSGTPVTIQPFSLAPHDPSRMFVADANMSPTWAHPFGTDWAGRDLFSRVLYGARYSLTIGLIATILALFIGIPLGSIAGYFGGWVDETIMRIVDVLYAFPFLVLAIAVIAVLGQGFWEMILALTIVGWISYARLIRGEVLSVKENEYVLAAKALGASNRSIIFKHIVPNAMAPVIVQATLSIGTVVLSAAALGFLGLGLTPGTAEWGTMLSDTRDTIAQGYWWVSVFPGLAIVGFVLAINLMGDGVNDALDPQGDTATKQRMQ